MSDETTGDWNSGNRNSGYGNSGNWNSGNGNSGNRNSGYGNSGNRNSGNRNSGNRNSGDWNSGYWNSGYWNSGNGNSGFFCTSTPPPLFFDQPVEGLSWDDAIDLIPWVELPVGCEWVDAEDMTDVEKQDHPNHTTTGGFLRVLEKDIRSAFPLAWARLDDATRQRFIDLPNFDAEKFLAITGVDVRSASSQPTPPSEVIVDGRRYVLAEES